MGSLLKEARSKTAGLVLGAFLLDVEKREERLAVIKPQNMTTLEWEEFVKYVCSAEFKVKRLQMQIIRQKNTTPHTISRKGYARLEEEMQQELNTKDEIPRVELWKAGHKQKQGKQPNIATQEALDKVNRYQEKHGTDCGSSLKDDILSKAHGKDRPGRDKGLGSWERIPRTVLDDGSSLHKVGESSSSQRIGTPNSGAASNYNLAGHRDISPRSGGPSGSSPSSRPTGVQVPKKNEACKLLSWYNEGEVVADGRIHETDPKKNIHGMPIGFGVYSVWVDHPLVDGALLYRPTSDLRRKSSLSEMAKSKNHTAHNQSRKAHKNGIKKPKKQRHTSTKGMDPKFLRNQRYARKHNKSGGASEVEE
ncbi:hypothetical protein MKW98_017435 [Papaver atlanticum]|uniref:Large ribosomal subunit protein eL29 n=1 Tax=Papaver atlanticum TaxID=357466 RepID=A0AAD4SSM5_9MAGN|nr:hypothetical protein MKW98_017435 [Papaver atlanticum]